MKNTESSSSDWKISILNSKSIAEARKYALKNNVREHIPQNNNLLFHDWRQKQREGEHALSNMQAVDINKSFGIAKGSDRQIVEKNPKISVLKENANLKAFFINKYVKSIVIRVAVIFFSSVEPHLSHENVSEFYILRKDSKNISIYNEFEINVSMNNCQTINNQVLGQKAFVESVINVENTNTQTNNLKVKGADVDKK